LAQVFVVAHHRRGIGYKSKNAQRNDDGGNGNNEGGLDHAYTLCGKLITGFNLTEFYQLCCDFYHN
jgi:hypothetical protein